MTYAVRRMPAQMNGGPPRIRIVRLLENGAIRHDLVALTAAEARSVALELLAEADLADIETTGGVPPTEGERSC